MYPSFAEDEEATEGYVPDTAEAGADNVATAQGSGTPVVGPPSNLPSVAAPQPQSSPADQAQASSLLQNPQAIAALNQRLQQQLQPEARWQQLMRAAIPAIAAAFTTGQGGTFGPLMQGYTNQLAAGEAQKDKQAQADLRIAAAIKDLELQNRAQAQIEARAKAQEATQLQAQAKARRAELEKTYTRLLSGGMVDRLNQMVDNGEDVKSYLANTKLQQLNDQGSPVTMADLFGVPGGQSGLFGVMDPDGQHFLSETKSPKEAALGTETDWVKRALSIAQAKNGGARLTDETKQAMVGAALKDYYSLKKDPDAEDIKKSNMRLQGIAEQLLIAERQQQIDKNKPVDASQMFDTTNEQGRANEKLAQDLAFGRTDLQGLNRVLSSRGGGGNISDRRAAIYLRASEVNPAFNPKLFEQNYRYSSSPQTQRALVSIDRTKKAIPSLLDASDAATRTGVKAINEHFVIPGGIQIGDSRYSDLAVAQKAFADELSSALGVNNATDLKTKLGMDMTDQNLSPAAFRSAIVGIVQPFLDRNQAAITSQSGVYGQGGSANPAPGGGTGDFYQDYLNRTNKKPQ